MGAMKARGFTLIELIVVISVVAVLTALLLPALRGAREQARSALCQTHIRQLQLSFKQYADSEDGFLPYSFDFGRWPGPPSGFSGNLTLDPLGWWWFDYLDVVNRTSLKNSDLLECPSKRLDSSHLARDLLWGNYGVNQSMCARTQVSMPGQPSRGRPISVNDIHHPGQKLLIVDSGYAITSWLLACDEPPTQFNGLSTTTPYIPGLLTNKDRKLDAEVKDDAISGRHSGKTVNIGFVDGHVDREKADDLLVEKIDEDTYSRRDSLWEP